MCALIALYEKRNAVLRRIALLRDVPQQSQSIEVYMNITNIIISTCIISPHSSVTCQLPPSITVIKVCISESAVLMILLTKT